MVSDREWPWLNGHTLGQYVGKKNRAQLEIGITYEYVVIVRRQNAKRCQVSIALFFKFNR